MEGDFFSLPVGVLGDFAARVKSGVMVAAETVKESSVSFAESVKEKSQSISIESISESLAENAALVKTKSLEVAENLKDKSAVVADSVKSGAVAMAENVQGRVAPKTIKREGSLFKQVSGGKWAQYHFELRDGLVHALATEYAEQPLFTVGLDSVLKAEVLDPLVTGKPFCFRLSIVLATNESTVVNNWDFFNINFFSAKKVNNQEVDLVLQANDETEVDGWVRDLTSTASGLAMQKQLQATGEGAKKFAEAVGVYAFVGKLTALVSENNAARQ